MSAPRWRAARALSKRCTGEEATAKCLNQLAEAAWRRGLDTADAVRSCPVDTAASLARCVTGLKALVASLLDTFEPTDHQRIELLGD